MLHSSTPDNYNWSADWEAVINCKNVAVVDLRYLGLVKMSKFKNVIKKLPELIFYLIKSLFLTSRMNFSSYQKWQS